MLNVYQCPDVLVGESYIFPNVLQKHYVNKFKKKMLFVVFIDISM